MPYNANIKMAKMPLAQRFPAPFIPDTRKKILLLILDGKYGTAWSGDDHQIFLEQLLEEHNVYASTPASAVHDIKYKNVKIILVIGVDTLHSTCDREGTIAALTSFAKNGGTVIFGGVPWGFSPHDEVNDEGVFHLLGLSWTVGKTVGAWTKRCATSPLMPMLRVKIPGTYLMNVKEEAALYRVCANKLGAKPAEGAQTAVAYQAFGNGYVGYVGWQEIFGENAYAMLMVLCQCVE